MSDLKVNVGVRNINLKNFRGNKQLWEIKQGYKETWDFVNCHRLTDVHIFTKNKVPFTYVSHIFLFFFEILITYHTLFHLRKSSTINKSYNLDYPGDFQRQKIFT